MSSTAPFRRRVFYSMSAARTPVWCKAISSWISIRCVRLDAWRTMKTGTTGASVIATRRASPLEVEAISLKNGTKNRFAALGILIERDAYAATVAQRAQDRTCRRMLADYSDPGPFAHERHQGLAGGKLSADRFSATRRLARKV